MDYYDKVIMAPMVRVGTLPMRLLAKRHGCQMIYGEEARDVCAIDINMGCPKFFSVQGGMGSALLSKPETIKDIRLLSNDNDTIDLLKIIESTGVKAIAVHMREIPERPKDPAHWDRLTNIMANASFGVPIIANGDIFSKPDLAACKSKTSANSLMIARGAIRNVSVFSPGEDMVPIEELVRQYIRLSLEMDNFYQNTKYVVTQMVTENNVQATAEGRGTSSAKNFDALCKVWGLEEDQKEILGRKKKINSTNISDKPTTTASTTSSSTTSTITTAKHQLDEEKDIDKSTDKQDDDGEEPCLKKYRKEHCA
eukprot:gene9134-10713_t